MCVCTSIMPGIAVYRVRSMAGPLHAPTLVMRSPSVVTQASFQTLAPSQIAPKW